MVKHTRFPWQVYHGGQDEFMVATARNGPRTIIAEIVGDSAIAKANAHLVSAAPDLLLALEQAHLDIITFLNEGDFKRHVVWDAGYIVDAIAKARGENGQS